MRNLVVLLLAALIFACSAAWFTDPIVQQHFGPWEWFLLPCIAVVMAVGGLLVAANVERWPKLVNLPDQKAFLALSGERKHHVYRHVRNLLTWVSLETVIVMILIQAGIYEGIDGNELNAYIFVGLAFALIVSPTIAFTFVGKIQSEVKRQLRE